MTNKKADKPGSDFNDVMHEQGLDAVKDQIEQSLAEQSANDDPAVPANETNTPAPSHNESEAFPLETLLKLYSYVMPDGKVWDASKKRLLKTLSFKNMVGQKRYKEWLEHPERDTKEMEDIYSLQASAQKEGAGEIGKALRRYIYLYPSDTVWDAQKREVIGMSALKYAIASCFGDWVAHPSRLQIDVDDLVFEPSGEIEEGQINRFHGIKMEPGGEFELAEPILALLVHLCNGEKEAFEFLLKWLAYPLQNLGSKMASAVLMHSETHGSGKSLFFEECWKAIYGEYGATLGQHQLESQYTDWRSSKLCAIFEEILSRDQKYSHTGTIKHMITGKTHRIEKKFVSGWEESNYMNAVFLSNEIQPFPLESSDRRFLVIWPETKLDEGLKKAVTESIAAGGVEAFYQYLLNMDLSDMTTHTEPPITKAKQSLIEFGRATWDVFYREWQAGELPVPWTTCETKDLFRMYRIWCAERHESCMGANKFSNLIGSRLRRRRDIKVSGSERKRIIFVVPDDQIKEGENQKEFYGRCLKEFSIALSSVDPEQNP